MASKIKIYEVGGSLRDEILGYKVKDRDYCVLADSYSEMRDFILFLGGKIYLEREEFFAIRCKIPNIGDADFTLARKEGFYSDGRHPDSVQPAATIEEELSRRDFTVNAMAREVGSSDIIDPFGGQISCHLKQLDCVGNEHDRFSEDSLRLLRAIRFSITKNLKIGRGVYLSLTNQKLVSLLKNISKERIREEVAKCFEFDTLKSFHTFYDFPLVLAEVLNTGLWFKPTLEQRNVKNKH